MSKTCWINQLTNIKQNMRGWVTDGFKSILINRAHVTLLTPWCFPGASLVSPGLPSLPRYVLFSGFNFVFNQFLCCGKPLTRTIFVQKRLELINTNRHHLYSSSNHGLEMSCFLKSIQKWNYTYLQNYQID